MEALLIQAFQEQILLQGRFVVRAGREADEALGALKIITAQPPRDEAQYLNAQTQFWASMQMIITASANIAKALWGEQRYPEIAARRAPLRESLAVRDDSPLKVLTLRNHFEHFDERLDRWWNQSYVHNYVDRNIGVRELAWADDVEMFRNYDQFTHELTFWGEEFAIASLVNEVRRVLGSTEERLAEAVRPRAPVVAASSTAQTPQGAATRPDSARHGWRTIAQRALRGVRRILGRG